jgi:hypothetical protein
VLQRWICSRALIGMGVVDLMRSFHVGQLQDVVDAVVAAVLDQVHHQLVVADAEFAEAPQAGARVHQVVQQHPVGAAPEFRRG